MDSRSGDALCEAGRQELIVDSVSSFGWDAQTSHMSIMCHVRTPSSGWIACSAAGATLGQSKVMSPQLRPLHMHFWRKLELLSSVSLRHDEIIVI